MRIPILNTLQTIGKEYKQAVDELHDAVNTGCPKTEETSPKKKNGDAEYPYKVEPPVNKKGNGKVPI